MKKFFSTIAMLVTVFTASAQVSYLQMVEARNQSAPDYVAPASLTPAIGTDQ